MDELTAYRAAERYIDELERELGAVESRHGRLLTLPGLPRPAAWAANVWLDPRQITIASISDAATDPAQLGGLCAALLPTGDADPGAAAKGLSQAARVRHATACYAARLVDIARCRDDPRSASLYEPLSER